MSDPWVPPYFGSWKELVAALLHNPFLGSVPHQPHPHADMLLAGPQPDPWRAGLALFISEISLKEVASRLLDGRSKSELLTAADESISRLIDDYCGTPPHPHPNPIAFVLAAELAALGESLPEGGLRNQLFSAAGQLMQRTFAIPTRAAAAAGASG